MGAKCTITFKKNDEESTFTVNEEQFNAAMAALIPPIELDNVADIVDALELGHADRARQLLEDFEVRQRQRHS